MDLMKIPRISYVLYQKNSTSHATLPIPSLLPPQHSCRLYDTQLSAGAHTILK